jgi:hypothetical protein
MDTNPPYPYVRIRGRACVHHAYAVLQRSHTGRPCRILTACGMEVYVPAATAPLKPGWGAMLGPNVGGAMPLCPRCRGVQARSSPIASGV